LKLLAAAPVAIVLTVAAPLLYVFWLSPSSTRSDGLTLANAIVIAGYVAFPVLAVLAVGLLFVALLLVAASRVRTTRAPARPSRPSRGTALRDRAG